MVDFSRMPGITSIRNFCKTYKYLIRKRFRSKKPPSSGETVEESKDNVERQNRAQQDPNQEGTTMNGIQSFGYNGDPLRRNNSRSSSGLYRHRSVDSCFSSIKSLSRNASRRSRTTTTSSPVNNGTSFESNPTTTTSSWKISSDNLTTPSPLSTNASRRSTNPIMFSNSSGMLKPPPIEKKLECTLEDLCYGCKKNIKITREVLTDSGGIVLEEELLTINVKPGWKKGTKITFEGKGNERPGAYREDIVFIIAEKRHQLFRREGDDLELTVEIPLLKALTGCSISVPLLGEEDVNLSMDDDIVYPGYETTITGQGMPISTEPENRGNLRITFLVV